MGMYTELIFGAKLKKDTPHNIVKTLRYMIGDLEKPDNLAFDVGRNPLGGGSYYFPVSGPVGEIWLDDIDGQWHISSRSNIKNYDNEIDKFLEWIKPYIDGGSGRRKIYAITIYEEDEMPNIYFLHED